MFLKHLSILVLPYLASQVQSDTFKFEGDPYNSQSDHTRTTETLHFGPGDGSVFRGAIMHPREQGVYPVVTVLGGMYGIVPEFGYDDILSDLVRKGFIVTYCFSVIDDDMEDWRQQFHWLYENTNKLLQDEHTSEWRDAEADMSKMITWCNSAGCEIAKFYAIEFNEFYSAHYMIDPVLKNDEVLNTLVETTALINIDSTEYCARCCMGKKHLEPMFESFSGTQLKLLATVNHAGHCSTLNYAEVVICSTIKFCIMDPEYTNREAINEMHRCVNGKMVAMYTEALWADASMRDYYIEPNNYCPDLVNTSMTVCEGEFCLN